MNKRGRLFLPTQIILLTIFCLTNVKVSEAQDIHYSQFYNSAINISPAFTGIFNGDQRIQASYRDQWRSVPVPWTTFSIAYDQKIYPKISEDYFFSAGILFNYDRQGLSEMNLSNLNITGSYTRILDSHNLLTFGLTIGYATRGLSMSSLTWDQQWNGDVFDPALPSGETIDAERIHFVENAAGITYRWQKDRRTKLDIGVGVYHLIEPQVSFFSTGDTKLPRRINLSVIGSAELLGSLDLQVHGISQFQDNHREYLFGALGKIYVEKQRGKEFELHLGAGYRTTKSLMPVIAIQYKNIYAAFSYDIDLSDFQTYTRNKGGPEFHFNYIITKVKPTSKFKICPIF